MNINQTDITDDKSQTFLPGLKPVLELLRSLPEQVDSVFILKGRKSKQTDEIIELCRKHGVRFNLVDEKTMSRMYGGLHQGVAARLHASEFVPLEDMLDALPSAPLPLILALDQVLDPGNAGTLARTLYALGGAGMIVPKHNGAYLGGAAAKASAGALAKLPVAKVSNLAQALDKAADRGINIYGADAGPESQSIYGFKPVLPAVLVLGSEESGIRQGIAKRCDALLSVPMRRDFDSLNVAQAGAILMGFIGAGI